MTRYPVCDAIVANLEPIYTANTVLNIFHVPISDFLCNRSLMIQIQSRSKFSFLGLSFKFLMRVYVYA